jgi:hypothetical protein
MDRRSLALSLLILPLLTRAAEAPEVTEDGLVRVPSSRKVGVYRAPDIPFTRYRRISIGDIAVAFHKNWYRKNPQLKEADRERLRGQMVRMYREELVAELVKRGGYALTDSTEPDVLHIDPSIIDLDVSAPDAGTVPGSRTFVRNAGSMQLTVELHDAASGVTVARIIDYETARDTGHLELADPVTNAQDLRELFTNVARYTRAALDVAKNRREP